MNGSFRIDKFQLCSSTKFTFTTKHTKATKDGFDAERWGCQTIAGVSLAPANRGDYHVALSFFIPSIRGENIFAKLDVETRRRDAREKIRDRQSELSDDDAHVVVLLGLELCLSRVTSASWMGARNRFEFGSTGSPSSRIYGASGVRRRVAKRF
jgi:hypothetical protein